MRVKKISEEEFGQLKLRGFGNSSPFYKAIIALKPGEALLISRKEYTLARGPGLVCRRIMKRFPQVKYNWGVMADGSGWAVKREK